MNLSKKRIVIAGGSGFLGLSMAGAYIVSSPNPKSQAEFMRTLRKVMGMPIGLPAFEWMVRIGAPLLTLHDARFENCI